MADRGAMKERHVAMATHARVKLRPQPHQLSGKIEDMALAGEPRGRGHAEAVGGWFLSLVHPSSSRCFGRGL